MKTTGLLCILTFLTITTTNTFSNSMTSEQMFGSLLIGLFLALIGCGMIIVEATRLNLNYQKS